MRAPAETLIIQNNARVFNAVGARNNHSCWYGGRLALRIAHKRCDGHFLAAAIDAAFRVDVGIDGPCWIATPYAPVRKIERVHRQIEKRVFTGTLFSNEDSRGETAFAFGDGRVELGIASGVGLGGCQHFVVAREKPDVAASNWCRVGKRANKRMHAICSRKRCQAQIGHDEPLRCPLAVVVF